MENKKPREYFQIFWKDIFTTLKKHGYPDQKALGLASDVSKSLERSLKNYCKDESPEGAVSIANKVKQYYIANFQDYFSKKTDPTSGDIEYYAGEAYINVLTNVLSIDMSIPKNKIWAGCYERSSKKERF